MGDVVTLTDTLVATWAASWWSTARDSVRAYWKKRRSGKNIDLTRQPGKPSATTKWCGQSRKNPIRRIQGWLQQARKSAKTNCAWRLMSWVKLWTTTAQSARHRIDSCKVLNDFAANGPDGVPAADRFIIYK